MQILSAVVGNVSRGVPSRGPPSAQREKGGGSSGEQSVLWRQACPPLRYLRSAIVYRGMRRRSAEDGDVIIPFILVQQDINPGNETLDGHGFNGAGGKELYTMAAVGDEIVAQADVQGDRLAPLPDSS